MKMWLAFSLPFFILALIFSFKDKSLSLGSFLLFGIGTCPSSVFLRAFNRSPAGSQTRERRGSFPEYLLFAVPLVGKKNGRLPGKFRQRNALYGMCPWRAPRGGLPLHGKYRRGTCLAYPQAKRAEGQDVLKEGGRLCALSGSAGAAWVEESVRAGGISYSCP